MSEESSQRTQQPLVSVVVPTLDDADVLPRALASIRDVSYPNVEIVVVDSSPDGAAREIAHAYGSVYLRDDPRGAAAARNLGIEEASGDYIAFLDADDVWLDGRVSTHVEALESSSADLAYADQLVTETGERKDASYVSAPALDGREPPHVAFFRRGDGLPMRTVTVDADVLEEFCFDEELRLCEDAHLWTRLLADVEHVYTPAALAVKYQSEESLTGDPERVFHFEELLIAKLCVAYPELRAVREEREARARYRVGRYALKHGRPRLARRYLVAAARRRLTDARVLVSLGTALLPERASRAAYRWLASAREAAR